MLSHLLRRSRKLIASESHFGATVTPEAMVVVAATDRRVKAIVAQCPVIGEALPAVKPDQANFETFKEIFRTGDVAGDSETTTGPLPVVSCDQAGTPSLLKPIQAFRWFIDYGGRHGAGWENRVTRVIPKTPVP
jgi:hypothetical protein